jgi:hypothetical protein
MSLTVQTVTVVCAAFAMQGALFWQDSLAKREDILNRDAKTGQPPQKDMGCVHGYFPLQSP